MEGLTVLQQAHEAGLAVWVEGDDLRIEGKPTPKAIALVDDLREHKADIIDCLRRQTQLIDLPFPIGYCGLPANEVARAEASNDRLGVVDPVARRLNVLMWMWSHYRDQGDMGMAGQMREAYHELRHADKSIQALCGLCEFQEL